VGNTRPVTHPGSRSSGSRTVRLALVVTIVLVGAAAAPRVASAATGPSGPSGPSVGGPLTPLVGSVAPVPAGAAVLGPTDASVSSTVDVVLRPRDPAGLDQFTREVSTPGSPRYHRYLAAGQLDATFGPTDGTVLATRDWLASTGLGVGRTSSDGLLIPVTGTAAQLEAAFAVPLVQARLADGRTVRLATRAPEVPGSLVPLLQGVVGLSDEAIATPHLVAPTTPPTTLATATPATASAASVPHALAPAVGPRPCATVTGDEPNAWNAQDLASAYGLTPLFAGGRTGAGEAIGIFELDTYDPTDIAAYQACYGTSVPVTDTLVDGGVGGSPQGSPEAALDIEVIAGLAPGASIHVYTGPNDGANGPLDTYDRMVSDDSAKVITTSWGQCEPAMGTDAQLAEASLFKMAYDQGQTVLAASGDSGSTDCYNPQQGSTDTSLAVDDPASQPYVTGVGGTSLSAVPPNAPSEVAWGAGGSTSNGAGGGGNSTTFEAAPWQKVAAAQSAATTYACGPHGNSQCREVPDVAASADQGHGDWMYFHGGWSVAGGTSMAAPLWAALVADVEQGCASPKSLLPAIYSAGASSAFHDVTSGNNRNPALPSSTASFSAGPGYDLATGWGSPSAPALLSLLSGSSSGCPTVTGLSPGAGPAVGGNTVVITGSGFGTAPSVTFNGVPAAIVGPSTGSTVTVTAPAGTPGPAVVLVTNPSAPGAGTSPATAASTYTYLAPVVTDVSPSKGPTAGGTQVVVSGSRFIGVHSVLFGGTPAVFRVDSEQSITATVPGGSAGTVDVTVSGSEGTSTRSPADHYTYALPGYWTVASDGGTFAFGAAGFFGSTGGLRLNKPIVGMAPNPDDQGYWLVASDGGTFAFGDAGFYGSTGGVALNRPIVGMASTQDGRGYWLVASDGGIFAFGDAGFYGSTGGVPLNRPIVGMAATQDGRGYWLVASDGGIFAFGDAGFHGSAGGFRLNRPIVGMSVDLTGDGYWLVASDGGIFAFGSAPFLGSTGNLTLNKPITGMSGT
jgi:hypothetical protein